MTSQDYADMERKKYVLSLDVGTTVVRAYVYDQNAQICGLSSEKIQVCHPKPGWSEMDPDILWNQVKSVIQYAITDAHISAADVSCMGITTQRCTFITWDKDTGKPFHNFITWQDLRSSSLVKSWNESMLIRAFNSTCCVLYWITGIKRYLAASVLAFKSGQVILRLKYQLTHNTQLLERVKEKKVNFGTLDTWLLWKLSGEHVFLTDYSCASSTGLYDPFQMEWSPILSRLIGIPLHILPPIQDTSSHFGKCSHSLFGCEFPITSMVADQQAAMFSQCCFEKGDMKLTMGTGTFFDCNTGSTPHASIAGLYPLIGWKIGKELVYIAEGFQSSTGVCIEWAKELGLYEDVALSSDLAKSVEHSDGVLFVPAFSGLQAPVNDDTASTILIGLTPKSSKAHIVRAILEGLAFSGHQVYSTILKETKTQLSTKIRCDGGVTNNDFLMQMLANLTGCSLVRAQHRDMTSLGAAFLAGLAVGVWKTKDDFIRLHGAERTFFPSSTSSDSHQQQYSLWKSAVARSKNWYSDVEV